MRKVRVEPCACVCTVRVRRLRTGEQSTRGGRVRRRGLRGALLSGESHRKAVDAKSCGPREQ